MHRQVAANAVAGAMIKVETRLPQGEPGQRIEMSAGGAGWKPTYFWW